MTDSTYARSLANKVPEATLVFWLVKIMCTTVGETFADYLNFNLGLGLVITAALMAVLLGIALLFQFRAPRYVPVVYWSVVVFISVVGTLLTDYFTDVRGVPLQVSTVVFSMVLAGVFAVWYRVERTLSIHDITTPRREAFYWLAILFTFALGTAAGDLFAEQFGLGYLASLLIFGTGIAAIVLAHFRLGMSAVLSFWLAYILTRPLGASLGDLLSQPNSAGGLGLGTTGTSAVFLALIVALVAYLTASGHGTGRALQEG